jgi:long-chain acyl-CoA synthetase
MNAMGIGKGDRVVLVLPRTPEIIISFLASVKIGAIPAPMNFNLTEKEVNAFFDSLQPAMAFIHNKFVDLVDEIAWKGYMAIVDKKEGSRDYLEWSSLLNASGENPGIDILPDDTAYLNFTSGSTGEQKGAITTHANLYWNTKSAVDTFNITEQDVHLCMFAAFAHPHELFARALYTGGTMVLLDEIFPKSLARTVREAGITCIMGLAPMYQMLLDVATKNDLKTLRLPESGGMYTNSNLIDRFQEAFGVPIIPVWGSTETTGIAIANRIGVRKGDSMGKPCPYYEVKAVDEDGAELKPGEIGEFIFKGPAVVTGYYKGLSTCLNNGWYYSGDLGRMDEEGYCFFVERKSSVMKVAGLKVYPLEIEEVLKNHPNIKEAVVIAASDGLKGETPLAIITLKGKQTLEKREIFSFCKGKLPNYKIPRKIEFCDEFPKIGSGKINRKAIIARHESDQKEKS